MFESAPFLCLNPHPHSHYFVRSNKFQIHLHNVPTTGPPMLLLVCTSRHTRCFHTTAFGYSINGPHFSSDIARTSLKSPVHRYPIAKFISLHWTWHWLLILFSTFMVQKHRFFATQITRHFVTPWVLNVFRLVDNDYKILLVQLGGVYKNDYHFS